MMINKIAIVGGHFAPAFACVEGAQIEDYDIVFFGRQHAFSEQKDTSLEYRTLKNFPRLTWVTIDSGRTPASFWQLLLSTSGLFINFVRALKILLIEQPKLVLAFGSYVSIPVCVAAWLIHIPIIIHEQTIIPGLANKFLSFFASKIFISFPQSQKYFPLHKTTLTGLPLIEAQSAVPSWYQKPSMPLLLVMGGSAGSHSLNLQIEELMPKLIKKFCVIHQTGDNHHQDFERLQKHATTQYFPREFLSPSEVRFLLEKAAVVVTRSGANTFFNLVQMQTPVVLVPLLWSAHNEQLELSKILEQAGVGKIYLQSEQTSKLYSIITEVYNQKESYKKNYDSLNPYRKFLVSGREIVKKALA